MPFPFPDSRNTGQPGNRRSKIQQACVLQLPAVLEVPAAEKHGNCHILRTVISMAAVTAASDVYKRQNHGRALPFHRFPPDAERGNPVASGR